MSQVEYFKNQKKLFESNDLNEVTNAITSEFRGGVKLTAEAATNKVRTLCKQAHDRLLSDIRQFQETVLDITDDMSDQIPEATIAKIQEQAMSSFKKSINEALSKA